MKLAVTGHRPQGLCSPPPWPGTAQFRGLTKFAEQELVLAKPSLVITGMALGWDMAVAQAAINLDIPFHAYLPIKEHSKMWPVASQKYHEELCSKAALVKIVSTGGYSNYVMQRRNEAMVRGCEELLALWSGKSGGTANCVVFAKSEMVQVTNCWQRWLEFIKKK